ncbi:GAF domain-containing protein [Neisseria sp. 23W00296]|uniref:GAF domain-containing protein n=1 Tax=unclassified Neisseria TaxID=2623750 RepID=UPI003757406C
MSDTLVRDYLQTQGLRLSADEVRMAHLAAQAVVGMGQAEIDRSVLWGGVVPSDYLPQDETTENLLKQVFMALDSAWDRSGARSAAVYLRLREAGVLLGLAQCGEVAEGLLPLDEETGWRHLASRSAQSGWLNLADDVARWLEFDELRGAAHAGSGSQMALPVTLENGTVLGVVYVEAAKKNAFDAAAQTVWVGLALALAEPLRQLAGEDEAQEDGHG